MITEKEILEALSGIKHPESKSDIVSSGIVRNVEVSDSGVTVALEFSKKRDPFGKSIRKQAEAAIAKLFTADPRAITVEINEPEQPAPPAEQPSTTGGIKHIVAVASGKGGVGKSTVTANLAVTLSEMGYRVGILDADIYGPSMPKMFGIEGYLPEAIVRDKEQYIIPAEVRGIKIISIGFFISPDDALVWRGPMATSALKQLIHQTMWDELDFLLVDLPPGTGDVHISLVTELKVDGAVMVSTPQQVALADVRRGIQMFRNKGVEVPILGMIENMAWFTPAELPDNRYYIFGRGGASATARAEGIDMLGEIPIIQSVMEGGESGQPAVTTNGEVKERYRSIASAIVNKLVSR